MAGRGYTVFDTGIGRCGIAWSDGGVIGVQLPEAREIETRRRLFQLYPEAREMRPPLNVEIAIEGIVALLRGQASDFCRGHARLRPASRPSTGGFTNSRAASRAAKPGPMARSPPACGRPARSHSVAQAISKNPFMLIVPCHRVLEAGSYADQISPHGGSISKRRLLSIEGAISARAARRCSTCCCRLRRRAPQT